MSTFWAFWPSARYTNIFALLVTFLQINLAKHHPPSLPPPHFHIFRFFLPFSHHPPFFPPPYFLPNFPSFLFQPPISFSLSISPTCNPKFKTLTWDLPFSLTISLFRLLLFYLSIYLFLSLSLSSLSLSHAHRHPLSLSLSASLIPSLSLRCKIILLKCQNGVKTWREKSLAGKTWKYFR